MRPLLALVCLVLTATAAAAQETRAVAGSLTYRERIALPPDATLLVELRDETGAIVAEMRRPTEGAQVPLPFALDVGSQGALSLRGALRVGDGIRWLSPPLEVAAGSAPVDLGPVTLRAFRPMGFASTLVCGALTAELGVLGEAARLRIGGRYRDLVQERTASGAKYADAADPGTWVWTKGDVATLSLDGVEFPECRAALPEDRYVARGNEPGWTLEIAGGQMVYRGDYGATEIAAPLPSPEIAEGGRRYAPEGADVTLTLVSALCHDDMTGMPYPHAAAIATGGRTLRGCGGDPVHLLAAHPWRVEDVGGAGVLDGSEVTIAFSAIGQRVSGSGGCNRYSAPVELTGEGLRLGPAASTMMACAEPLMIQERRLFEALARVDRFDIASDGALLLIAGDASVLTARP